MKPLLRAINLSKEYDGKPVLNNLNLEVEKGERLAIVGPNGSGKTTLIRILNLLTSPTNGEVYIGETEASSAKDNWSLRRRMSVVFQKPMVFNFNVYENIAVGLRMRGMKKDTIESKVIESMAYFGLSELRNKNARKLSGGEKQLLAIARATVVEPELLLLDEPTSSLDLKNTSLVKDFLETMNSAIIITSPTSSTQLNCDKSLHIK
jgi:tungstate transport system ATP-binding protein